jgi:hypothetical protein
MMGYAQGLSGADVDAHLTHVWRLRDLRVASIETYFDPARAAASRGGGTVWRRRVCACPARCPSIGSPGP